MKELIFGLIGGTALLMYGVDKMGEGLEKASGEMMKKILNVLTGRVWSAFLVGTFLTALVQSSTAITVLTVGFVNAGLMKLPQAIGIIYGANIGTTITAQIMSASYSFNLTDIALPILGIGFTISYFAKNKTLKNLGDAIMGFGMMFLGLKILNGGIPFLKESVKLKFFFEHYASNPLVGILLGAMVTALVHSSSATIALVMVLAEAGLIDIRTSILIMLGDNIGTCITAQLASLAGNINARRTAWGHTLYNIFGVVLAGATLPLFVKLVIWSTNYLQGANNISAQIANSHTIFNIISAVIFLPLTRYYVKFLETFIRGKEDKTKKTLYLDKLLLDTPVAALKASISETVRGAEVARNMVKNVLDSFYDKGPEKIELVNKDEQTINMLQKEVTSYIVDLSKRKLTHSQSVMVPAIINNINNVERIGDHAIDISELSQSRIDGNLVFTKEAIDELKDVEATVLEMIDTTITALKDNNINLVPKIIELEDKTDELSKKLNSNHLRRLDEGSCCVEAGVLFIDIVNHLERIADHAYKIAMSLQDELQGTLKFDE